MRPAWAERIPPAMSLKGELVIVPTGVATMVIPADGTRFAITFFGHMQGDVYYLPHIHETGILQWIGMVNASETFRHLTYCEHGKLVQVQWDAYHLQGADRYLLVAQHFIPADAWAKIHAESITDMRPPSQYP